MDIKQYSGFVRAPFDFIHDQEFYEVKVVSWTSPPKDRRWQKETCFNVTEEEIKFINLMQGKYHLYLIILFPDHEEWYEIPYDILMEWIKGVKRALAGFATSKQKVIKISKRRIEKLKKLRYVEGCDSFETYHARKAKG